MSTIINADTSDGLKFTSDTSGEIKLQSAGTDTVTVDTSGNVGIGTSSPTTELDVSGTVQSQNNAASNDSVVGAYKFYNTNASASANPIRASIVGGRENSAWGAYLQFNTSTGTNAQAERMRLDQYGLHVGNTNLTFAGVTVDIANIPSGEGVGIKANSVGNFMIEFRNSSGTNCGTIVHNTSSSVSYNTTSDYRLKENTVNIDNGIEKVKLLKPYRFNYITDPDVVMDGFYAHEVQDVVPSAIHGTKDAVDDEGNPVYQGIDQAKLVPLLTAALQEAITKIEDLETRIQALENA